MSTDTTHESVQRTSILGGEIARRGLTGIAAPVLITWSTALVGGITAYFVIGGGTPAVAFVALLWLGVFAATFEFGDRSYAAAKLHSLRTWSRTRRGEHIFRHPLDPAYGQPGLDPGWEYPVPLGRTEPLDVVGTGLDEMFIVRTANPGEKPYCTVVLAVQGLAGGLRTDAAWASTSEKFGRFGASMAKATSLIRGIQILHRSIPADLTMHEDWVEHQVEALGDLRLSAPVASYGNLLDTIRPHTEEHRTYVVLKFPQSDAFEDAASRAAGGKNARFEGGIAQVVRDETMRAVSKLVSAGFGRVEVLGEQRTCAVIRAFIDPTHRLDRHQGARWSNCWPSYIGGENAAVISGRWHTRVGIMPPASIEPVELGPLWLAPLLTGVSPDPGDDETAPSPTIRTISVRMDFVRDKIARESASHDFTQDEAAQETQRRKGKIGDGSSEVMATASGRRRQDLKPGSGHHGVIYSMAIAVTGRDEDDLERACMRVSESADESAIKTIDWQSDDHDVALFATLPLGRGLAVTRYTK
ncbi:SCO6880 family protein [Rhodococcoides fascians]|uniref:SCO6880 family protein n=1 Tax=Rhodococcoides fascians TaxID=1828 RepID=UPI00056396B6|nr:MULTISPECIES: SCO6880 family protein [Rhodococcus]OZF01246.1 hypothetical protein CH301_10860 [Rhodococcus sp. 15-1189-1-1a]OZF15418.1 hypothetical protein CH299_11410 [Rhodococcus sp. 14-2686-1-2]